MLKSFEKGQKNTNFVSHARNNAIGILNSLAGNIDQSKYINLKPTLFFLGENLFCSQICDFVSFCYRRVDRQIVSFATAYFATVP